MEDALDHLSPEERAERLNQWAQEAGRTAADGERSVFGTAEASAVPRCFETRSLEKRIPKDGKDGKGNSQSYWIGLYT